MQTLLGKHWHHLPAEEILQLLETNTECGLDRFEVKHRQEHFGRNVITPPRGQSPLVRFLMQLNNPLIYVLLAAAVITAIIKDPVDAAIILGVVLLNAVIGYVQEARAEKAIEALAQAMTTETTVLRSGQAERLNAAELVPGDVVVLKSGDKVPADLRLIKSRDLQVAEAALTGESVPVEKDALVSLAIETGLGDRRNMAYASTLVTYGQSTAIVVATGDSTEVGRISQLIASAQDLTTPLTRRMAQFSQVVLYVILALAVVAFVVGVLRGQSAVETFTAAIALAVAMIPEGLPAALTVTLAIGVARMARRRAIIRKLPAVEALGSTTVICSDKTGTLTQNQMTVQQVVAGGQQYQVSGTGYNPEGGLQPAGESNPALVETLQAGLLCNDSSLVQAQEAWEAHGDPTEVALIVSARKGPLTEATVQQAYPRLDAIPFESQHQYMATLHRTPEGQHIVYIKGAVEVLLERCTQALDASGQLVPWEAGSSTQQDAIHQQVSEMAAQGMRVLAFARREIPASTENLTHEHLETGLTFLGLQGMIDPPRPESMAAVRACQRAGIQVKMITGDHALTAAAIATQIGMQGERDPQTGKLAVLAGKELAALTDEQLIEAAERTAVFARVSPEQKLRLVEALQVRKHVVAMTGDGVNDGPALKQSDIGVAMGVSGTEVAKEAADMVLTDDNFATIEAAVEEGRGIFDNLTKIIAWTLPINLGQGLIILAALLLGVALPIMPIQILWINMTTGGALGVVLALEHKEKGIMSRRPRDPSTPILTPELLWRVVIVGALILVTAFGLYEWELANGASLNAARTVALNVVVMVEIFYLFNCRSLTHSMFRVGFFSNPWVHLGVAAMLAGQLLITYIPALNPIFYTAPIGLDAWVRIVAAGFAGYLLIEIEKWLRRRF